MSERLEINIKKCWTTWAEVGFGITVVCCFAKESFSPVGTIYLIYCGAGNLGKEHVELLQAYVRPDCRRQGVLSAMQAALFESYGADGIAVITTKMGSDTGGRAFLEHWGYRLDKRTDTWSLTQAAWKRRKRAMERAQDGA